MVIDGKKIAAGILAELKKRPVPRKFLATVLVSGDAASVSFVKQKERVAKKLGVDFRVARFPADIFEAALRKEIEKLAEDDACGGIILQLPLPEHMNREEIIKAILVEKDVDALHSDLVLSPAVGVVEEILLTTHYSLPTKTVAVAGFGFLVGQPVAKWLGGKVKELIALDIGDDLAQLKDADVVILGVGKACLVKPEMLKNDALVIDFGYSRGADSVLCGDFDPSSLRPTPYIPHPISYTPTPGGTGPILVAKLFENFYALNP
ncbi:MAG: bifunctional 5,10-methylenetetrahydrofolate dehydrogenase/5,10-methenyltetrahydrofolate cyclohydrolase [Candidatus Jorgensenbacteria bacterium]|nr:bifunctional 5,10-methylenetetrahydrofolate dehydrogenase/5,10-methenyltetrahydrofolate cyclohydrolase [Candidatus Jorgensenbacteria bacterium]